MSMTRPRCCVFSIGGEDVGLESLGDGVAQLDVHRRQQHVAHPQDRDRPRHAQPAFSVMALPTRIERELDALLQAAARVHRRDVDPQLDDGPRDLRADAREDGLRAEEANRRPSSSPGCRPPWCPPRRRRRCRR